MAFTVPVALDTSKPDWKRQFRSIKRCECGERIGWVVYEDTEAQRDRWAPYNDSDGQLHFATCPKRESFRKLSRETNGAAAEPPPASSPAPPPPPSRPKPAPRQAGLFGDTAPQRYGVD